MNRINWNIDKITCELADEYMINKGNVTFNEALEIAEEIMLDEEKDFYGEMITSEIENNKNYTGCFLVNHNGVTKRLMVENVDKFLEVIDNQDYEHDFTADFYDDKIEIEIERGLRKEKYLLSPISKERYGQKV